MLEGATSVITMLQTDRPTCKKSRVVLPSPESKIRIIYLRKRRWYMFSPARPNSFVCLSVRRITQTRAYSKDFLIIHTPSPPPSPPLLPPFPSRLPSLPLPSPLPSSFPSPFPLPSPSPPLRSRPP